MKNTLITAGPVAEGKISKLGDYSGGGDVADPWYTGDFADAYRQIYSGCAALLKRLKE